MRGIIRDSLISRDCPMGTPNRNALPIAQSGSRLGNRSYCHVGGSTSTADTEISLYAYPMDVAERLVSIL
jgi:hypothetical protein